MIYIYGTITIAYLVWAFVSWLAGVILRWRDRQKQRETVARAIAQAETIVFEGRRRERQ